MFIEILVSSGICWYPYKVAEEKVFGCGFCANTKCVGGLHLEILYRYCGPHLCVCVCMCACMCVCVCLFVFVSMFMVANALGPYIAVGKFT